MIAPLLAVYRHASIQKRPAAAAIGLKLLGQLPKHFTDFFSMFFDSLEIEKKAAFDSFDNNPASRSGICLTNLLCFGFGKLALFTG